MHPHSDRRFAPIVPIAAALVLLLVITSLAPSSSLGRASGSVDRPGTAAWANGTLVGGPVVANASPTFWGVDVHTPCADCLASNPALGSYVNSTPLTYFRAFNGGDVCNQTTNTEWSSNGTASIGCGFNDSAFVRWCLSRTAPCQSEFVLPGEINSTIVAVETVRYVEDVLHYRPTYWTIGSSPWDWRHYNESWPNWRSTDNSRPTAEALTVEVRDYVTAVRAVDPTIRVLPDTGSWQALTTVTDLTRYDASYLAGLSFFLYPGGRGTSNASLQQFYASLNEAGNGTTLHGNISSNLANWRGAMTEYCATCASLPVFIDEYNAALNVSPYASELASYPDAVFLAASVTQALRDNITALTFMHLQGIGNTLPYDLIDPNNSVTPVGTAYQRIFSQMTMGAVRATQVVSSLGSDVFSVETQSVGGASVLVVNVNLTTTLNLSFSGIYQAGTWGTAISWAPGVTTPLTQTGPLGGAYAVPPQGILLLNIPLSPSPGSYSLHGVVTNSTSGLPLAGATVTVGPTGLTGRTGSSGGYAFFVPNGSYSVTVAAPGYLPATTSTSVSGGPVALDVALQPSPPSLGTPPPASAAPPWYLQHLGVIMFTAALTLVAVEVAEMYLKTRGERNRRRSDQGRDVPKRKRRGR